MSSRDLMLPGLFLLLSIILLPDVASAKRTCRISVSPVNFGTYTPGTANDVDTVGQIAVRCRGRSGRGQPTSYALLIDGGLSANSADRRMQNGLSNLAYNLFQDAARMIIWGDGSGGTAPVFQAIGRRGLFRRQHNIYGRTFAGQYPETGIYGDNTLVTLEF